MRFGLAHFLAGVVGMGLALAGVIIGGPILYHFLFFTGSVTLHALPRLVTANVLSLIGVALLYFAARGKGEPQ